MKTKSRKYNKAKSLKAIPSYSSLTQISQEKVDLWFRATSTSESYKRYVKEGKEWAQKWARDLDEMPAGTGDENTGEGWSRSEVESAFESIGISTPRVLHAFVVYKCEVMENSYKTAEAIRSAFKHYFT